MSRNVGWAKIGISFGCPDRFLGFPGDASGKLIGWLFRGWKELNKPFGYVQQKECDNLFPNG